MRVIWGEKQNDFIALCAAETQVYAQDKTEEHYAGSRKGWFPVLGSDTGEVGFVTFIKSQFIISFGALKCWGLGQIFPLSGAQCDHL